MSDKNIEFLNQLGSVIEQRKVSAKKDSYTTELFSAGRARIAQKFGEEAVELIIASMQNDASRTVSEAADLMYHLLVLLSEKNLSLADVASELRRRHPQ
jgi:phosphoribosyl-ATP pyrophosphohydrolase